MSPKMVLVWMSWAFILTSFINCQTLDDAFDNLFRRLTKVERMINGNANNNCNTNTISLAKRNLLGGEAPVQRAYGDNEDDGNERTGYALLRNYGELADGSQQRGYRLRKLKRNRGRYNNLDRIFPSKPDYPYSGSMATDLNHNQNQNINTNVISRRSYLTAAPAQRDSDSYSLMADA